MLTLAGALSIAVMTASGALAAAPAYNQNTPSPLLAAQEKYGTIPWHYVWQYHFNKFGEVVPGWVAVLNHR
ncbi:MAG TPA: hypothetical protein VMF86_13790 [Stellaceae bacterium]|nr:hypothetical protein [Stellaceae bacterium]